MGFWGRLIVRECKLVEVGLMGFVEVVVARVEQKERRSSGVSGEEDKEEARQVGMAFFLTKITPFPPFFVLLKLAH